MFRSILLAVALVACGCGYAVASDVEYSDLSPAVRVNVGETQAEVCRRQKQEAPKQETAVTTEVTFEKKSDFDPFSLGVCAVAGVLGAGLAVYTSVKQEVK